MINLIVLFLFFWNDINLQNYHTQITCNVKVNANVLTIHPIYSRKEDDIFRIVSDCDLIYSKTSIFHSKYCHKIFEEINSNEGFQGKWDGKDLPDGNYNYFIEYQTVNNKDTMYLNGKLAIRR